MIVLEHKMGSKKHKKHKSERKERHESPSSVEKPGLKLILKVGSQGTPEHSNEWPYPYNVDSNDTLRSHHKKSKKKKKKKDRNKDRERKHRHHHKEKKRKRDEESGVSFNLDEPSGEILSANDENSIGSPGLFNSFNYHFILILFAL